MRKIQEKHSVPANIIDGPTGSKELVRGGQSARQFKKSLKKSRRMNKK